MRVTERGSGGAVRIALAIGLVAASLVGAPRSASAAPIAVYDETFGFKGPAGNYAYGGDWDPTTNTILWGDYWNYRVKRYTIDGQKCTQALCGSPFVVTTTKPEGQLGGIGAPYDVETDVTDLDASGPRVVLGRGPGERADRPVRLRGAVAPDDRSRRGRVRRRAPRPRVRPRLHEREHADPHPHLGEPRQREPVRLGSALRADPRLHALRGLPLPVRLVGVEAGHGARRPEAPRDRGRAATGTATGSGTCTSSSTTTGRSWSSTGRAGTSG
ncbi:MAG: hypothetical protein KatS3mg014_1658 [Actinomycetota bacterium]|nr:MAG: hypothetical protein KatS3mg014_1658 [Actinomycetota bacterium]